MTFDTFRCPANVARLDELVAFVEACADRFGLATKKKFGLLVALEEAFVNVCHYAYKEGEGDVSVGCGADGDAFVVEIADSGDAFDVLSLPDPDTTADLMDRQIGGLGVYFIRSLTDQVSYRREAGQNIVRMVFRQTEEPLQ